MKLSLLFPCCVGETNEPPVWRFRPEGEAMRSTMVATAAAFILVSGCSRRAANEAEPNANAPVSSVARPPPPLPSAPPPATRAAKPQAEPTIDPKSPAAAQELVIDFAQLLNQSKFGEAYMLLGPGAPPRKDFDERFAPYSGLNVSTGKPGEPEGAAGSIYIEVPLTITGTDKSGKRVERSASAVLRRVNDVPGSTEEQRHWHIERIDWKTAT
jgi:hypothetical protein